MPKKKVKRGVKRAANGELRREDAGEAGTEVEEVRGRGFLERAVLVETLEALRPETVRMCGVGASSLSACARELAQRDAGVPCATAEQASALVAAAAVLSEATLAAERKAGCRARTPRAPTADRVALYRALVRLCTVPHTAAEPLRHDFAGWAARMGRTHAALPALPAAYAFLMLLVVHAHRSGRKTITLEWVYDHCVRSAISCRNVVVTTTTTTSASSTSTSSSTSSASSSSAVSVSPPSTTSSTTTAIPSGAPLRDGGVLPDAVLATVALRYYALCARVARAGALRVMRECRALLAATAPEWPLLDLIGFSRVVAQLDVPGFAHPVRVVNSVDTKPFPTDFQWISANRFRSKRLESLLEDDSFIIGCSCSGSGSGSGAAASSAAAASSGLRAFSCSDDPYSCECIAEALHYRGDGTLYHKDPAHYIVPNTLLFECNSKCACGLDCPNRLTQQGVRHPLEIFKTANGRGWGVRVSPSSPHPVPRCAFVGEYLGEIMSVAESRDDPETHGEHGELITYQYQLDIEGDSTSEHPHARRGRHKKQSRSGGSSSGGTGSGGTSGGSEGGNDFDDNEMYVIDARRYGSVTRFFNHSCEPTLFCVFFWVEHWMKKLPRIAFFTARALNPGEELTFDYHIQGSMIPCACGSKRCRGFL